MHGQSDKGQKDGRRRSVFVQYIAASLYTIRYEYEHGVEWFDLVQYCIRGKNLTLRRLATSHAFPLAIDR